MTNDSDCAQEFQRRRREVWKTAKLWIFVAVLGFVAIPLVGITGFSIPPLEPFMMLLVPVIAIIFSLGRVVLIVSAKYRCPRCNKIPWTDSFSEQGGLDLDPDFCSSCKARLK